MKRGLVRNGLCCVLPRASLAIATVGFLFVGPLPVGAAIIYGTDGPDMLEGGLYRDQIYGYGGNDWINSRQGPDDVYGDGGDDELYGGDGNDFLSGGPSSTGWHGDWLIGQNGNDYVYDGVSGNDRDYGCGRGDNDTVHVADGDTYDFAVGGEGSNTLHWDSPGDQWNYGVANCPP